MDFFLNFYGVSLVAIPEEEIIIPEPVIPEPVIVPPHLPMPNYVRLTTDEEESQVEKYKDALDIPPQHLCQVKDRDMILSNIAGEDTKGDGEAIIRPCGAGAIYRVELPTGSGVSCCGVHFMTAVNQQLLRVQELDLLFNNGQILISELKWDEQE